MILKQYYLGCLAQASYLVGDEKTGSAVIVDPRRDVDEYIDEAKTLGLEIKHVLLTHFHADFISGHVELRERTGADIRMGAKADPEFPFVAMKDGDLLELGDVRLQVLETPGHTPESVCILVFENAEAKDPHAVFTGDTLFIGDVGRPDLMASVGITAKELAGQLYDSTRSKLLTLPDQTLLYPGHGAGSACGKNLSTDTVSTIGRQRRLNYALQPMARDEFVQMISKGQSTAPAYFAYDADLNRKERITLDENLKKVMVPLSAEEVVQRMGEGAHLVDTRDPSDFTLHYVRGSVNIGLGGSYASWVGCLLDREKPVVILSDPGREQESVMRLGRIGFDNVAGYVQGGIEAFAGEPGMRGGGSRLSPKEMDAAVRVGDGGVVLDVRTPGEWEAGHVKGCIHIPLTELGARSEEVPRDKEVMVYCRTGYRSSIAASMLRKQGFDPVTDLIGGIQAWEGEGLEVETVQPA